MNEYKNEYLHQNKKAQPAFYYERLRLNIWMNLKIVCL